MSTENSPPGSGFKVACCPIHAVMRFASTRCSNTRSMGASMSIDVAKSGTPLLRRGLGRLLQRAQLRRPEVADEIVDCCKAIGTDHKHVARAIALFGHKAGTAQNAQVMRCDLLRQSELRRDLSHGARLVPHQRQDAAPVAVGKGAPGTVGRGVRCVHANYSSNHLYKCQLVIGPPLLTAG